MLFLKIKAVFIQQYHMLLLTTQQNYDFSTVRRVMHISLDKRFPCVIQGHGRKCKNSL